MNAGYLEDPYIPLFFKDQDAGLRKQPMLNLGTLIRTKFIDEKILEFIDHFSSSASVVQILSLGAGWDTRAYILSDILQHQRQGKCTPKIEYYEIDFEHVFRKKKMILSSLPLENLSLHLIGSDLSYWPTCLAELIRDDFNPALPTFVLCELVFVYLPQSTTSIILHSLRDILSKEARYLIVEPFTNGNDPFGSQLQSHFSQSSLPTSILLEFPTKESQLKRFSTFQPSLVTMFELYETWLSLGEKKRLHTLQWMDELEEWKLLANHYLFILNKL